MMGSQLAEVVDDTGAYGDCNGLMLLQHFLDHHHILPLGVKLLLLNNELVNIDSSRLHFAVDILACRFPCVAVSDNHSFLPREMLLEQYGYFRMYAMPHHKIFGLGSHQQTFLNHLFVCHKK